WWDWYGGPEAVQVQGDALCFRRWQPVYDPAGNYVDANSNLWVVDLHDADAPTAASVTITDDPNGWWGNLQVVGATLYSGHYEWYDRSTTTAGGGGNYEWTVRYFADRIDLSDRAHPRVGSRINVPGLLVGGSPTDPSLLYTIDYRWDSNVAKNDFDVVRVGADRAELISTTTLAGWVGSTFVRGPIAYLSAQQYSDGASGGGSTVR